MAVTETPPETVAAASETAPSAPRSQPTGLAAVLGSGDHKVIGRLYIVTGLIFGLGVVSLAEAFGIEALQPDTLDVFSSDWAAQLFTLTRVGMVFLLALPLAIGVAMVVVPLQVGARTIAFPRAAAASYWGWALGGVLLVSSYLADGGPFGSDEAGVRLWLAAMGVLVLAVVTAAICLATTVLALRTPGLSLDRVPMYAWSVFVAAVLWILTLPVLFGLIVLAYVDNRHGTGVGLGSPGSLYAQVGWVLRNPQIYVVAIPVLGFAADVLATTARTRFGFRAIAQGAIAAFGTFSFGAFMVVGSTTAIESPLFIGLNLLAVLPILGVLASVADLFRKGSFRFNPAVVFAAASVLVLLVGLLGGAVGSIRGVLDAPEGASLADNILFLGVGHAVVIASVIASMGGLVWWATKVGRNQAVGGLAAIGGLLLLVGGIAASVPDMVSGIAGEGAELAGDYTGGIEALNVVTVIGIGLVSLGVLATLAALVPLLKRPEGEVPADPWEGATLEWLAPSPPPLDNFTDELAPVTSGEPLIDLREEK